LIIFNHVRLIYKNFRVDVHKLRIEDMKMIVKQNWGSTQCIASRHVQRCLEEIRSTTSGRTKMTLGIETFLTIIVNYTDIFMSYSLNIWERVQNTFKFIISSCYGYVGYKNNSIVNINFIYR
jgi:hypothetical protein